MKAATLRKYGWRKIASDAHALQLMRRELKHHANCQQRDPYRKWDFRPLLEIKTGAWFKLLTDSRNGAYSIMTWPNVEEDE